MNVSTALLSLYILIKLNFVLFEFHLKCNTGAPYNFFFMRCVLDRTLYLSTVALVVKGIISGLLRYFARGCSAQPNAEHALGSYEMLYNQSTS